MNQKPKKFIEELNEIMIEMLSSIPIYGVLFKKMILPREELTVDERIIIIDKAKASLIEGIKAIDELRSEAEFRKKETKELIDQISQLEQQKKIAEDEAEKIKYLIQSDVLSFRKIAGITKADKRKQQIIGFIWGILASLIATGLIYFVKWVITFRNQPLS